MQLDKVYGGVGMLMGGVSFVFVSVRQQETGDLGVCLGG